MNNIHKDCFAYQDGSVKGCSILKELYCKSGQCKFYKTDRNGKYPGQLSEREEFNIRIQGIDI